MSRTSSSSQSSKGRSRGAGKPKSPMHWYTMDLHVHTPASADYEQPGVTYLDIMRQAVTRGLDIIALTDHNTVAGCAALAREIEELTLLERLGRIHPDEKKRLDEYRELGEQLLVLPGFEFTATFGFHIIGIFSPQTPLRELEHVLLRLNVPAQKLDSGSTEVGASTDVLTAYRIINEAGGLVVAAHANANSGVAMQGIPFGGQTKIAWTQDPHLHALEVTDLESRRRNATASFFSGSKPEYPRRMHCIQGSDAHRLERDSRDRNRLGIGDRVTEVLLPEPSFETLKEVFTGNDFARTRPYRPAKEPFDHVQAAREQGPTIVQSFHESMAQRGGRLFAVLCDVCAYANGKGGTIYIGASSNPKAKPVGISNTDEAIALLKSQVAGKITPLLDVEVDWLESKAKRIVRVVVPEGKEKPYAVDQSKIYIRQEAETSLAVRDEIVQLVRTQIQPQVEAEVKRDGDRKAEPAEPEKKEDLAGLVTPPNTGVEIVESLERKGTLYHTVRDLRNGNLVQNVSRSSARKLWRYAITEHETSPVDPSKVSWKGDLGIWKQTKRQGRQRYDLVQRDAEKNLHVYYGVSDEGIHGPWREVVGIDVAVES